MENVYCIVPVRNRKDITLKFLDQWKRQTYTNKRLVIVDDGSSDGTREALLDQCGNEVTLLTSDGSAWWGGAIHAALEFLFPLLDDDDFVLLLNDDVLIEENFVRTLVSHCIAGERSSVVVAAQYTVSGRRLASGYRIDFLRGAFVPVELGSDQRIDAVPGRGVLIPALAVKRAGNVRVHLFRHYLCDLDYSYRLKLAGYRLEICEGARVVTGEESSDAETEQRLVKQYIAFKSKKNIVQRLRFFRHNGPVALRAISEPRVLMFAALRALRRAITERHTKDE